MSRRFSSTFAHAARLAVLGALAGCGSSGATTDAASDTPTSNGAITIKTYPVGSPFTGATANADLVAFQDGDGAWTALTGSAGVYAAAATGARFAVAVGCRLGGRSSVVLYYQTIADGTELNLGGCRDKLDTVHITASLLNIEPTDRAEVWFGGFPGNGVGSAVIGVDVPRSSVEVFARSTSSATTTSYVPAKLLRGPTVYLTVDEMLDFDLGGLGKPPESHVLAIQGDDPAESLAIATMYATATTKLRWPVASTSAPTKPFSYLTLDPSLRQASDATEVQVTSTRASADGMVKRFAHQAFSDPVALSVALPPAINAGAPLFDRTRIPRVTITFPLAPATLTSVDYTATIGTLTPSNESRTWVVILRASWAGSATSVTITTPDLSGLTGWTDELALAPDSLVVWTLERDDRTKPYGTPPVDGLKVLGSMVGGTIMP